ncbi:LytR/AlgR family response regulator transcription factor [Parapedobacter tibetensis]|uniref:LytR/AlgR family response regulator transcription factor n=1 Tax=Parapedobacter tibetensis TaxID=2972951 RepID=UPI00214D4769|nr:LytTR family DNA-binding domain-containing protein [Parapedobacter tibetensis]
MDILIFEDEKDNAERLIHLLGKCPIKLTSVQTLGSVADGIEWFGKHGDGADLVFMDIKLADGDCFELFDQVESRIPIIFITAYDSFALKAFKLFSVDYLMKPIDLLELQDALKKFEQFQNPARQHHQLERVMEAYFMRKDVRFVGKLNNQLVYVHARDIAYIQIAHGIVWATSHTGNRTPFDYTLDQTEQLLDKASFFRINRKAIIHIDAIAKITTYANSRLEIKLAPDDGDTHIVSRERVNDFKDWLAGRRRN